MDWINDTQKAINYIEKHLLEDICNEDVARSIYASSDYFSKIFRIVTGFSVGEYIRNRRLSLAGEDLLSSKDKIIDIAMKYRYETPESFSKAFARFHGVTPSESIMIRGGLKFFSPLTIQIDVKGGFIMSRRLISNVSKLYENPAENYMFPSCMRSVAGALNEGDEMDFLFFAGITGDLFTQIWREPKWQYNDSYSSVCKDTQLPIKAAFDACGYIYEYLNKNDITGKRHECIQKIVSSIDKGLPVLTFGIVGPPVCSVICGYDENGDVLIGWSQFTDEPREDIQTDLITSENYFSVRNGLDRSEALIFLKEKGKTPDIADSMRTSILNVPVWGRLPSSNHLFFGEKAFEKWAESLLCDECFENESMLEGPLDTYGSCIVLTGTNLHYMKEYLDRAMQYCPDLKNIIEKLKLAYDKENEVFQKVLEFQGGYFFESDRKALLNRKFRIKLAGLIKQVGQCYTEAARVIDCSE
jgi:AraC-like DNA-binding protein